MFAHPSRDSGIALAVAGTPAEAWENDDEGDDVEDGGDDGEDQLHLQEGERQPNLNRFIHYRDSRQDFSHISHILLLSEDYSILVGTWDILFCEYN